MKKKFKINNEELFLKAQQGDESAREELLVENDRLCYHIAQKFESTRISIDDLASMCRIGLIKAFNTFKPEKNIKFATYATRIMTNEILMYLRKTKKLKKEVSINQALNIDSDGNELTVEDIYAAPETEYTFDDYETARKTIDIFNANAKEKYRQVFQLRIIEGKTQIEAGEILGISQSYVARMTIAIKAMLKHIAETGSYKHMAANIKQETKKVNKMEELDMAKNGLKKSDFRYIFENYPKLTNKEIAKLTGYKKQSVINYKSFYKNGKWADVKPAINHELMEKINNYIVEQKTEKVKKPKAAIEPFPYLHTTVSDATIEAARNIQLDRYKEYETTPIDFEDEKKPGVYVETSNDPSPELPATYVHFNPETKIPASEAAIAFAYTGKTPEEIGKEAAKKVMDNMKKCLQDKVSAEKAEETIKEYKKEKEKNIIIKNEIALMSNNRDEISDLIYGIYQMIKNSPAGEVKIEMKYEVSV